MTIQLGGAPLGNQNARQHGLYSQKSPLPPAEQIDALRAYIASLVARLPALQTPRQVGLALRRVTLASNALNRLIRAQLFAQAPAPAAAPGFGYPTPPAPRPTFSNQQSTISTSGSSFNNQQSTISTSGSSFSNQHAPSGAPRVSTIINPWTARFPFVHPVLFNLVHLLASAGLSGHSP